MKIYAVGGSVRDSLLNRESHDNDYVVVGSTIEEMLNTGFKQVGKEFPVFLHPITGEEYALARKEVSTGKGYTDFKFEFGSDITLQEDLERRDFTMNALAKDMETNEIIDYFHGKQDIENKLIRHVNSEHFTEDPLRVLRACRFSAQLDFMIHSDTIILCRQMARLGMLSHLTEERVWKEIEKALSTSNFDLFLHYLELCNAIQIILPEISILNDVPEALNWHPEGNVFAHTMLCYRALKSHFKELRGHDLALVNFGILCHDLGKQLTDKEKWPSHHGHDILGSEIVERLCARLKIPNEFRDFGKVCCKYHMKLYTFLDMSLKKQYDMINEITKFKDRKFLDLLLKVHICDLFGKKRPCTDDEVQYCINTISRINTIYSILHNIGLEQLPKDKQEMLSKFEGKKFGELYRAEKIDYLRKRLK